MKLPLKTITGQDAGEVEVGFEIIPNGKGTQAVHDVVTAYRAAQRSGTACTKTAGEVAGTNKKPWRQKGTGRARAGSFQSPLFVGGGVVFGPKPRDFSKKVNAKTRQLALRKALGERIKAGDVIVVDDIAISAPKTKAFIAILKALGIEKTALFVANDVNKNLLLSSRNVPNIEITTGTLLNTYQVLRSDKLVISRGALEQVGQRLNKN
jgi:large subunit ribosomal protein L4